MLTDEELLTIFSTPGMTREEALRAVSNATLRDYADLLDSPQYTLNYTTGFTMHDQIIALMRRDSEIFS